VENSIPNRGLPPSALEGSEEELRYYLIELQRLWSFHAISSKLVNKISDGIFNFIPSWLKDISTPDFSTPSFNPGPFNPRLFNNELFNHEFLNYGVEISSI
jgi:hypothetical protein